MTALTERAKHPRPWPRPAARSEPPLWTSDRHGLESIACLQAQYHLLNRREMEPELLPVCARHGLGLMTFSPLAVGLLSGRFRRGQPPEEGTAWARGRWDFEEVMNEQADRVVQLVIDIGRARGCSPAEVAIAWILDHGEVTSVIIGPDTPEQVDENFRALDLRLTEEERTALDEASEGIEPRITP